MARQSSRYRVHLSVRYGSAAEFVREYAENLSAGGMFIAGATDLSPLEEVPIEIELPGYGTFRVKGEVAHVVDAASAARMGRSPGAGIAIKGAPEAFTDAMRGYLARLGSRADHLVLAQDPAVRELVAAAGYQVGPAPEPDKLVAVVARSETAVVGVLVRKLSYPAYRDQAVAAGAGDLVRVAEGGADVDDVLAKLDENLS